MVKEFFEQDMEVIDELPKKANPRANNKAYAGGLNANVLALVKNGVKSHSDHTLSVKEEKFIEHYLETGSAMESAEFAGYSGKNRATLNSRGNELLNRSYIIDEIRYRVDLMRSERIASTQEILEYFSSVMRGEILDQFGLEAPLSERTKAAQELAKRIIDSEIGSDKKGENIVRVVIERPENTEPLKLAGDVFNSMAESEVIDEGN